MIAPDEARQDGLQRDRARIDDAAADRLRDVERQVGAGEVQRTRADHREPGRDRLRRDRGRDGVRGVVKPVREIEQQRDHDHQDELEHGRSIPFRGVAIQPRCRRRSRHRISPQDYGIFRADAKARMYAACRACRARAVGSTRERPPRPRKVIFMPLVSMRQLLDEAAKGGYGVGAFNVNNMEQIQAIMEAARETASPVIIQASRGARAYTNDRFLCHLMLAAVELYPEIPGRAAPRPRQQPRDLQVGDRARLHERDDGRLAGGGRQDAVLLRVQRRGHARGRRGGAREGRHGRGRARHAWAASRTASARAKCTSPTRPGGRVRRPHRASTRSRSRSARATAPTSSIAKPDGEVLAMT